MPVHAHDDRRTTTATTHSDAGHSRLTRRAQNRPKSIAPIRPSGAPSRSRIDGDEEARDREEHRHADEPAGNEPRQTGRRPGMEQHDEHDGDRPQPVERRVVAQPRGRGGHRHVDAVIVWIVARSNAGANRVALAISTHAEQCPRMQPLEAHRPPGVRGTAGRGGRRATTTHWATITIEEPERRRAVVGGEGRRPRATRPARPPPDPADQHRTRRRWR